MAERPPIPARPARKPKIKSTLAMNASSRSRLVALALVLTSAALAAADSAPVANRPAQATATVAPVVPYMLRRAEAAAEVTVSFNVNAKGVVTDLKVIESTNPDFVAPTLDALKKWAFTPALKDGKPIDSRMQQTFTFNVRGEPAPATVAKRNR
jgi:TonB family protein